MLELFKQLWLGWKRGIRVIVLAQSRVVLTLAYMLAIGPAALYFRLRGVSLLDRAPRDPNAKTFWTRRSDKPATMSDAARPF